MKRDALRIAVETIEREGLLAPGAGEKVAARLAELLAPKRDPSRSAAAIVAWLGGVLVAGSLLLFVASNWEALGKTTRLTLIFGTLAALHVAGYRFAEEPGRRPALGRALTATAMVGFGGAIGLVAQIYHLSSIYPNAILAWWLLCVPFALLTRSRLLLLIPLAIFVLWAHLHAFRWIELNMRGGAFFWSDSQVVALALLEVALAALLAALGAIARAGGFERFTLPLSLLGRVAVLVGLFVLSFEEFSPNFVANDGERLLDPARLRELGLLLAPASVAGGAALLSLAFVASASSRRRESRMELEDAGGSLLIGILLAATLLLIPPATFLAANALLIGAVIALVMRGVARGRGSDVNLAVVAFLVAAMARYFEFVAEGFEPVFAFLGAGVLLLALGSFLERKRRRWLRQASATPDRSSP